jgi:hypothetical protein
MTVVRLKARSAQVAGSGTATTRSPVVCVKVKDWVPVPYPKSAVPDQIPEELVRVPTETVAL